MKQELQEKIDNLRKEETLLYRQFAKKLSRYLKDAGFYYISIDLLFTYFYLSDYITEEEKVTLASLDKRIIIEFMHDYELDKDRLHIIEKASAKKVEAFKKRVGR